MDKTKDYNIEGVLLSIPLQYDELSGKYIELYPDFIENPVYTTKGHPVMFTGEDACDYAVETADGEICIDCGSCRFYRQIPDTLIGVCIHEKKRHRI